MNKTMSYEEIVKGSETTKTDYQAIAVSTVDEALDDARARGQSYTREEMAIGCLAELFEIVNGQLGTLATLRRETHELRADDIAAGLGPSAPVASWRM